jgi:hypothetical protein
MPKLVNALNCLSHFALLHSYRTDAETNKTANANWHPRTILMLTQNGLDSYIQAVFFQRCSRMFEHSHRSQTFQTQRNANRKLAD